MAGQGFAFLLALLIGVSLGALGSGGSIVTLPILVYVAGIAPKSAVGMSMTIVGATSLLGCYFHWRRANFAPRAALLFSATGNPPTGIGRTAKRFKGGRTYPLNRKTFDPRPRNRADIRKYRELFPIALAAEILLFAVERPGTGGPQTLN